MLVIKYVYCKYKYIYVYCIVYRMFYLRSESIRDFPDELSFGVTCAKTLKVAFVLDSYYKRDKETHLKAPSINVYIHIYICIKENIYMCVYVTKKLYNIFLYIYMYTHIVVLKVGFKPFHNSQNTKDKT